MSIDSNSLAASKVEKALSNGPNLDSCSPHSPAEEGLICLQIPYESPKPITQHNIAHHPPIASPYTSVTTFHSLDCLLCIRSLDIGLFCFPPVSHGQIIARRLLDLYATRPSTAANLDSPVRVKTLRNPREGTIYSPQYTHTQSAQS
jgi:hypothetical protein